MVTGMDSFLEKFRDFPGCYTIIGGAACDILMSDAELPFRATKDIDMILVLEDNYKDFVRALWEYLREGGYRYGWKTSSTPHFYRFTDPNPGYPAIIELFSRNPGYDLDENSAVMPLHIDDSISSLSAIILDDEYYTFMKQGRTTVNGASVLRAEYLIPFKMFAWLDFVRQKEQGNHVDARDLRKHKLDVFRLLQIVPANARVASSARIQENIRTFLAAMAEEELPLRQIGVPLSKQEALTLLKGVYL